MKTESGCSAVPLTAGVVSDAKKERSRCTVRLQTFAWNDGKGLHIKRSLTFLRRQCVGHNALEEEAESLDAQRAIANILNLNECKDGVYEVVVCNVSHDWETGYADDWSYRLVPILTLPPKNGFLVEG